MASARLDRLPLRGASLATRALLATLAVVGTVLAALPVTSMTASAAVDVPIGIAPEQPAGVAAVSAPAAGTTLQFQVALAPRDPKALADFVSAVSTPGSPQYQHYLAAGTFGARFGATPATIDAVSAALRSRGLSVGTAASNGLSIPVSGTVAQTSAALRTSFKQYRLRSGRSGLANTTAPQLPANIAAQVQGFAGLNQLTHATAQHTGSNGLASGSNGLAPGSAGVLASASASTLSSTAAASTTGGPVACTTAATTATATGAYLPAQIAQHYGIDSLYGSTTGHGATVAFFELEPFAAADIAAYQACFGTHAAITVKPVGGGAGTGTGSGEAALDIEQVIGLAPAANLLVYEAANDGASVYDELRQIADDDLAQVVSDSWGLCEAEAGVAELATLERPVLQQMAAQGQTVLAATGDSGSEGCYSPPDSTDTSLSVWEPASQPEVTAVGGTTIAAPTAADTAWNNAFGATGGGISTLWSMPAYQHQLGTIGESSAAPCGVLAGQLCREVPDVSASADVAHGSLAYYGGAWHTIGGTSAATPLWASIVALVDSTCTSGPVGFLNPALYQLAASNSPALVDVGTGPDNDFTGDHPGSYVTKTGYDLTTGLGRPAAGALDTGLCPATDVSGSGSMTVTPPVVSPGTTATLTFMYTPTAGHGMADGELDLTIPGTWTLPTTTPTTAGFTTSSAGVTTIVGTTIVVTGLTVPAGKTATITYGDTSAGAQAARTPSAPQISVFAARSRPSATGATAALAINPAVRVAMPGASGAGQAVLTRAAGADRIATSIAASQTGFPTYGSAGAVVLARADQYPDAIAGVPLAAHDDAPLLLTPSNVLLPSVAAEIQRVLPLGGQVILLGGTVSLSPAVEAQVRALGYLPTRLQGATRFDTAVSVANALGDPTTIFEVDGTNFPDALSAGPAAAITRGAVLFTNNRLPVAATTGYLALHRGDIRYAVGGNAAAADPVAARIVGVNRYETSMLVAQTFFVSPSMAGIASGEQFPDALSGGPIAALMGGPLVLVPPKGALPAATQSYLGQIANTVLRGWIFGGTVAISTKIADDVAQSLVLVPPSS